MKLAWSLLVLAALSFTPPFGAAGSTASHPRWAWPVGPNHTVIRPFIAPSTRYAAGHRGIDIAAAPGAAVFAPNDGVVSFAGVVVDRPVLSIRHADGVISSYEPVTTTLTAGSEIDRGQQIGTLVAGHCAVSCLHFGVRRHGEYVSPMLFLGDLPRSVLLPTRSPIVEG